MISILIPTYNYTTYPLAEALSQQVEASGTPCEIIVADDASTLDGCKQANRCIQSLPHCTYIELEKNIGRSAIRNLLADKARGEWLLFMDCDGMPTDDHFLSNYVQAIAEHPEADIVNGGIVHPSTLPSPDVSLRYLYEKQAEPHYTAAQRSKRPYTSFRTFNFLIRSTAFHRVRYDESIRHYGYEDVLFGARLQASGFRLLHIDNPLENRDIEPNDLFLKKTEEALRTLTEHTDKLGNYVLIHRRYKQLEQVGLAPLVRFLFRQAAPMLRRNLTSSSPRLSCFALYKMGYYATLRK